MELNPFDLSVIIIVGLSALLSFYRGFVREMMSLGGWLLASFVTLRFLEPVTKYLKPQIKSEVIASGVAAVGLFFITLIVISVASGLLLKALKPGDKVGLLDNLAGLVFGVVRGALIVAIAFFILNIVVTEKNYPDWVKGAYTRPYAEEAAQWLKTLMPDYLDKISGKAKDAAKDAGAESKAKMDEMIQKLEKSRAEAAKKLDNTTAEIDKNSDDLPTMKDLQERMNEENERH